MTKLQALIEEYRDAIIWTLIGAIAGVFLALGLSLTTTATDDDGGSEVTPPTPAAPLPPAVTPPEQDPPNETTQLPTA